MLRIGWATEAIVPPAPAMVQGQMHVRIARETMDPLTATAMAISGQRPDGRADQAVLVSLDLAYISDELQAGVRAQVAAQCPDLPPDKVFLAATHSHTSLVFGEGFYPPSSDRAVMSPKACEAFLVARVSAAVVRAWRGLAPAQLAPAYGHAVVAHNRRPVYANGQAQMYGSPGRADFRVIEGPEDHSVDMIFVWDATARLSGVLLSVPCPSQVDEGLSVWSADFWHETRLELRRRLGTELFVLPLCGAAGDQSPHFIFDRQQEAEMRRRRGVSERQEIALRLADAVQRALACTPPPPASEPVAVVHELRRLTLSPRQITREERDWAAATHAKTIGQMDPRLWWPARLRQVVAEFEGTQKAAPVPVELHGLRLGSTVLLSNPFELYTDYGYRIKARSVAEQTILAQLAAGIGWYLPTERAVVGGGYGAIPAVSIVGPQGGQELVEHSVALVAELFPEKARK